MENLTGLAERHASSSAAFSTIMEEFIDHDFGRDQDHGRVIGASRSKEGKSWHDSGTTILPGAF